MLVAESPETRRSNREWPMVPLGEIADVKLGKMLDRKKRIKGKRLPYLRNINVRWGRVDTEDVFEMPFEDHEMDRYGLQQGDVLVCEGGEPGRAAVWDGKMPEMKFQKAIHRIRFNVPFEPLLLVYYLELLAKTGGLERRFTGSTIKHFTRQAIIQIPIPIPPLDEQLRIVEEIEQQFTRLDAGVAALRSAQTKLKRYRAAVLKAACEGKLVPTEAELARKDGRSYETGEELLQRILVERREKWSGRGKYTEPVVSKDEIISDIPPGWSCSTLAALGALENGDRSKNYPSRSAFVDEGVPFINAGYLNDGRVCMEEMNFISEGRYKLLRSGKVLPGDLLFCLRGSLGKVALIINLEQAAIASSLVIVRAADGVLPKYLLCYLSSWWARQMIAKYNNGSAQPNLSAADLSKFVVPLPPLAEQTRIVAEAELRLSLGKELESAVSTNLQRATSLRQSILSATA